MIEKLLQMAIDKQDWDIVKLVVADLQEKPKNIEQNTVKYYKKAPSIKEVLTSDKKFPQIVNVPFGQEKNIKIIEEEPLLNNPPMIERPISIIIQEEDDTPQGAELDNLKKLTKVEETLIDNKPVKKNKFAEFTANTRKDGTELKPGAARRIPIKPVVDRANLMRWSDKERGDPGIFVKPISSGESERQSDEVEATCSACGRVEKTTALFANQSFGERGERYYRCNSCIASGNHGNRRPARDDGEISNE
jgi:hypothetical protein